jgi:hypothetical protein
MKPACADFTWPLLGHQEVLKLISMLRSSHVVLS